jgi:hypothetical protein
MFRGFNEYHDEVRITFYLDTLEGCTAEEVWEAVKIWRQQPVDRAAKAGELRNIIMTARGTKVRIEFDDETWTAQRVTPEEKREIIKGLTPAAKAFLREALKTVVPQLMADIPVDELESNAVAQIAARECRKRR